MDNCTVWHADKSIYRKTYYETIKRASEVLSAGVLDKLGVPEARPLTDEYVNLDNRFMIMGQESLDNRKPLTGITAYEAWSAQIGENIAFNFAYGAEQESNPFWRAYQSVTSSLGLKNRRQTAWSNLSKVQLRSPKGSYSIENLSPQERLEIIHWQRELFRAELEFSKPDAIVFLTGNMTWILKHMLEGLTITPMGDGTETFNVISADGLDIPMVQTYHPNARNVENIAGRRANALEFIKAEFGIRNDPV